jgi:hypothetical protein
MVPVSIDFVYILVKIGATWSFRSFITLLFMLSRPHALWGLRLFKRFSTPLSFMCICSIIGWGLGPLSGMSCGGSCVNTDWNCWLRMFVIKNWNIQYKQNNAKFTGNILRTSYLTYPLKTLINISTRILNQKSFLATSKALERTTRA